MEVILLDIGIVIGVAALAGVAASLFKQPTILGYIIAGLVLSTVITSQSTTEILHLFSTLGVAFLLFMLGIELKITEIHEVGLVSLLTGVGQVLVTSAIGFSLAHYVFGFGVIEAGYVGVALTFSSTIIIIKLLGEKGDLDSLYGRISVGMLIVQDLIAIVALITLNSLGQAGETGLIGLPQKLLEILIVGVLLVLLTFVLGRLVSRLLRFFTGSTELLLLGVLGWALFLALLTQKIGFSLEVGAFLAGLVLATSPLNVEIAAKIRPLRDFFIVIFFVVLGMSMTLGGFIENIVPVMAFSISVLVGNPLILLLIMGVMGYHRRVSFLTGLTVSQISEFSLILVGTGVALGQVQETTLATVTGVGIITLIGSSYLIHHGEMLYKIFARPLRFFERRALRHELPRIDSQKIEVLVIGAHRMGRVVLQAGVENNVGVLAIDYDPVTIRRLRKSGYNVVYGDVADIRISQGLGLDKLKVVVSTVPGIEDNLFLLNQIREDFSTSEKRPMIIVRAEDKKQAEILRDHGADYALVPEEVAGEKVRMIISKLNTGKI